MSPTVSLEWAVCELPWFQRYKQMRIGLLNMLAFANDSEYVIPYIPFKGATPLCSLFLLFIQLLKRF